MIHVKRFIFVFPLLVMVYGESIADYSNLTHSCKITPMVVCLNMVQVLNKTCVDPMCLISSGGNYSLCTSPLVSSIITVGNNSTENLNSTSGNTTRSNNTIISRNTTSLTCNATWIYPFNASFCMNASTWSKTICSQTNITCKINSTKCSLNAVVYLGGFFDLLDQDGFGNLPAAELAVSQINNENKTLENITLSLIAKRSTQSLLSYGTQLLYNYLHSGPTKLMLLLPQENDLARTVAAYAGLQRWGTLQFSYGTTENTLASDKNLFPRFYRLNPLEITYNRLRAEFVSSFPFWRLDVGLLYFANSYYQEVNDDLNKRLKAKGINVVANVGFRSSAAEALYLLKEKNAHIIISSFPYSYAKTMFCKAFQLDMYGPHYVWVTFNLMPLKFWIPKANDDLECSEDEMTCVVEGHFSFYGTRLYNPATSKLIHADPQSNLTFAETYNDLVNSTENRTNVAPYVYDAIWTMTNILQRARSELKKQGKLLNNLSYGEETELLERLAYDTDFNGVTGRIRFYENGNRKFGMSVLQVRKNGVGYYVGNYDVDKDEYSGSENILWQGFKASEGGWSYRRTAKTYKWRYIELALLIVWCLLAALGIIYAIFCLFFVIKYRRERSILYSSPTINGFIILGCIFNFISVILFGVDHQHANISIMTVLCKIRLWIFSTGFTLCIGGLWVKVWTLYQILIERKVHGKRKMEYRMCGILVVLMVIDIAYLTTWTVIDGLYRSYETAIDQPAYKCFEKLSGNPFISSIWYIETCDCDNLALWSAIFLVYKALVLSSGVYMAWRVREVYTRQLIDAQYCATLLLLAFPFCILGLIFAYTLRLYPTAHYALLGIFLICYTSIVLGFLYGHKIILLFCRRPNMIKVRSKDETGKMKCCSGIFAVCCAPVAKCCTSIVACLAGCFCVCCCPFNCCKVLWDALLHGPRKNRGSFVKESENMDFQVGDMPGDKDRQIIILQREVNKREEELRRLRGQHCTTLTTKATQTVDYYSTHSIGAQRSDEGLNNEVYSSDNEESNDDKHRTGRPNHIRFKVYHQKLDFSHVSSKVDSRLENRISRKKESSTVSENGERELRHESSTSGIAMLRKTLAEREKELAQLKAYIGMNLSSGADTSSKIGSLPSVGEERNTPTPPESEVPNRNISSVTIAIPNSDSDEDSKENVGDVSNDKVPSDASNTELLGESLAVVDQEQQQGIYSDSQAADDFDEKANQTEKKDKSKQNVLSSAYGSFAISGAHISHYNSGGNSGKFKKKVRQLSSFGIFARKPRSDIRSDDENNVMKSSDSQVGGEVEQTSTDSQPNINVTPILKSKSSEDIPLGENNGNDSQKSRNKIKIFNAPTDWSHVKSRLGQDVLKPSPNLRRKSKVGIENDADENEKMRNTVKIFNAPSDYSHVKSRLFDPSVNQDENLLKPSPTPRRKTKGGIEDDVDIKAGFDGEKRRGSKVKIFNSSSDYTHVKSRLFDPNASGNSENQLEPSPNLRRNSKVGVEEDDGERRGSGVKIFNASLDYSHVKSRLYDGNTDTSRPGEEKENQFSKSRSNVKIFNAPSDYSNARSRLFNTSNKTNENESKNKVLGMNVAGTLKNKQKNEQDSNKQQKQEAAIV